MDKLVEDVEGYAQAGMCGHHIIGHGITSRADTPRTRIASAAVAALLAQARRQTIDAGE